MRTSFYFIGQKNAYMDGMRAIPFKGLVRMGRVNQSSGREPKPENDTELSKSVNFHRNQPLGMHGEVCFNSVPSYVIKEELIYVNVKQYYVILKRSFLRAKVEMEIGASRAIKAGEMEAILQARNYQVPACEIIDVLAHRFSRNMLYIVPCRRQATKTTDIGDVHFWGTAELLFVVTFTDPPLGGRRSSLPIAPRPGNLPQWRCARASLVAGVYLFFVQGTMPSSSVRRGIRILSATGPWERADPTRIRVPELEESTNDPLPRSGKGILQPHHFIDELDNINFDDSSRTKLSDGPFGEVLKFVQEAIILPPFVAVAIWPRPCLWEFLSVNVYILSVEELTVPEYLCFKGERVDGQHSSCSRPVCSRDVPWCTAYDCILDQVGALENEMLQKIKKQGLLTTPHILIVC
ncbi:sucrose synthase [Striga asiatica]|uniref:sucrose synthase n=1 Tax=Striga asiatica TaxID=4170 RepID=A0A5A7PVM9_STRAF|nr:sucrose synthase [Striga asiatica]